MRRTLSFASLAILVVAYGCQASQTSLEDRFIGTYQGKIEQPKPASDKPEDKAANAFGNAFLSALKPTLEIKKDHTFTMTMLFPFEGTWTLTGSKATLTITKFMGLDSKSFPSNGANKAPDNNKPMILNVSDDGKTLTAEPSSGAPGTSADSSLTFTKTSS